jgi:hypothetical protein
MIDMVMGSGNGGMRHHQTASSEEPGMMMGEIKDEESVEEDELLFGLGRMGTRLGLVRHRLLVFHLAVTMSFHFHFISNVYVFGRPRPRTPLDPPALPPLNNFTLNVTVDLGESVDTALRVCVVFVSPLPLLLDPRRLSLPTLYSHVSVSVRMA